VSDNVFHETKGCPLNIAAQIEERRAGRRKFIHHGGTLCSKCLERPPTSGQRYCNPCHAEANRASRARLSRELKRLRALEQKQQLSKGKDNGQSKKEITADKA
jgi:hypothetical protein